MITDRLPHDEVAAPLWEVIEAIAPRAVRGDIADQDIGQLLISMQETHGSIRAIITHAQRFEEKTKAATGRWADALVLARAQMDAVFIGLLLVHDPEKYAEWYHKSGWATDAQMVFYYMRRFKKVSSGRAVFNKNVRALKFRARLCGVSVNEWIATLSEVRGKPLRFGASAGDAIRPFPTPGKARELIEFGTFGELAGVLWQEWKFLCDPAHAGLGILALRYGLRSEQMGPLGSPLRETMTYECTIGPAIHCSLVSITTLATVFAERHRTDVSLIAMITNAWSVIQKGTRIGGIVWEKWAYKALGALIP